MYFFFTSTTLYVIVFSLPFIIAVIAAVVFCAGFLYLFFKNISSKKNDINNNISQANDMYYKQTLLQATVEIHEQAFVNLRQQIHDNIGQTLSLAKLNLNTAGDQPNAEKIILTEELLGKAIAELREISKYLYSENIAMQGLSNALQNEIKTISKITSLRAKFIAPPYEPALGNEQTIILFRTVQLILNNIIRYAKATDVVTEIISFTDTLAITINDNGKNAYFQYASENENLKFIEDRLKMIGAKISADSESEKGNFVKLEIYAPGNM